MQRRNLESMRRDTIRQFEFKQTDAQLKIAELERELRTFFEENGISSDLFLPHFEKIVAEQKLYESMLGTVRLKLVELEPIFNLVTKMIDEDPDNWVERLKNHPRVRNHERVREIERDLKSLESEMTAKLKTSGPGHQMIKDLESQIDRKRSLLRDEKEAILREVIDDVEDYRARSDKLTAYLDGVQDQYSKYARMRSQFDELNGRIASLKEERSRAVETLNTLITGSQSEEETIEIVEYAERPMNPVSPNVAMSLILAAVFGLIGGIGVALVLEYLDDTVKSKEEVDRLGRGIPFLGLIPNISAAKGDTALKDLYAYRQPKSTVAEAFRGVRTALSFGDGSEDKTQRVFLVTSSGPKEGKTTVTLNIATVLAYSGYKTLVIDADLRRPRVHKSFAKSNQVGLTNLIIGRGDDGELIQNTVVENLDILASGPIPPNPSELLGRPRIQEILDELLETYDRIVIDSPPLGAVTDAAVLGRITDGVILVVHAGRTRRKLIERALEQLRNINVRFAGLVLNNLKSSATRYYPGYYQYYYYSPYTSDEKARKKKGA